MRTFVIGDIHGCFEELQELLQLVQITDEDTLIALGDIVDRGSYSKKVYTFLRQRPNTIVLVGNHERKHQRKILTYAQEIVRLQFGADYPEFLTWLNTLPYFYETDSAIIVHAAFEHDVPLQQQRKEVLAGSTSGERYLAEKYAPNTYWNEYYQGEKPVIYGHHIVGDIPHQLNKTYGIDTGACHGQYLTALELPNFHIHQVKAKKDYWKENQKTWQIPILKAKPWLTMNFEEIEQQIQKLSYRTEQEVVDYLASMSLWKENILALYPTLKTSLEQFAQHLLENHPTDFNIQASTFPFKSYLFKSKANNLTMNDLKRGLDTPQKVLSLAKALGLDIEGFG